MPAIPFEVLEPLKDDYWALTDRQGKVLAKLAIAGKRLATDAKDKRLQEEVAFLNRHLEHPALGWDNAEHFLGVYAGSPDNIRAEIQVRPMFH
jgi:hypothetical protein